MKLSLGVLFFVTAILYASVGFGGGSTYNALLVMSGADYRVIPIIALACNIVVVSGNIIRFRRAGILDLRACLPLVILSVPLAWIGGRIPVSEILFMGLLALALFLAGIRLLWTSFKTVSPPGRFGDTKKSNPMTMALIGGGIGFYAGIVGIGGGIFLAPILHMINWANPRKIAAACSFFILVNSLAGLGGQLTKLADMQLLALASPYWPLVPAVLIGGMIGNHLGISKFSESWIKRLTGILILYVALRLALRWVMMGGLI